MNEQPSSGRWWIVFGAVLLVCVVGGALGVWWSSEPLKRTGTKRSPGKPKNEETDPHPLGRNDLANATPVAGPARSGYMGPQACAECHQERVASLANSSHFRTCRLPDPKDMPAGFAPGEGTFQSHDPNLRFEMQRDGNSYVQTAVTSTRSGEKRVKTRIDLVYGAGG